MTITFDSDYDVMVYALEKIIGFARDNQYLFVANCAWCIAVVIGLDSGLITHIDNLEARKIGRHRVLATLREFAKSLSVDADQGHIEESLTQNRNDNQSSRTTR